VDENPKRKSDRECEQEVSLANADREELTRLRAAERSRRQKAADKRAAARAKAREGIRTDAVPQSIEFQVLQSVLQYAEERMHEATWTPHETRAAELAPLTIDVVEVPRIREMVRRYAQALSNAWLSSSEQIDLSQDVPPCTECGAPRLEVELVVSDRL
tara:strand:- start:2759 stop:3235 length:477 start_codon:yes stop_codon:yes gene_type:complete